MWALILADIYGACAPNQDELIQQSCIYMRADLFAWYSTQKRLNPGRKLQQLQDLRPSMLGSVPHPSLSTKAAETGTLLGFCYDMLRKHEAKLGERGGLLRAVGHELVSAQDLMGTCGPKMTRHECEQLCNHARRAFALRGVAQIPFTPKWHLFLHICQRAYYFGNPRTYSTFIDEGYNGRLAALAGQCHRQTWHKRVLAGFRMTYSMAKRARRG